MSETTLLVVGAREGSLGDRIAQAAQGFAVDRVVTAGMTTEDHSCDVRNPRSIVRVLDTVAPDYVVCTVGINLPTSLAEPIFEDVMMHSFAANVIGPMTLLQRFITLGSEIAREDQVRKFVVISSNSARIARTNSLPYCASKAALSMAVRVAAREMAPWDLNLVVWGYEPGLLAGTPMTEETERRFGGNGPLHRMPGVAPEGLDPRGLASRVVYDLVNGGPAYHGVLFPYDAGEQ